MTPPTLLLWLLNYFTKSSKYQKNSDRKQNPEAQNKQCFYTSSIIPSSHLIPLCSSLPPLSLLPPSLSSPLSLSLFSSLCSCLFDALMVGWMTEAIRLFRPRTYVELSCPVRRAVDSPAQPLLKQRAASDSDAKVGGTGPGGRLNRLTVASPTLSLSQSRYPDKWLKHCKLEMWTAFKRDLQIKDCSRYSSGSFWRWTKALDLICWYDCYLLWSLPQPRSRNGISASALS